MPQKQLLIAGIIALVVIGGCFMLGNLPGGWRVLINDHGVLNSTTNPYYTHDFVIEAENPIVSAEITTHTEGRDVEVYIFTQEQYYYWYQVTDGRIKKTHEPDYVWHQPDVVKLETDNINLPGPGKYLFVIHNHGWREVAVEFKWAVKDGE